jgi:hypothetical protein
VRYMKRKKMLAVLAGILAVGLIAGPLAAEEWSSGQEYEWVDLDCLEDGNYPPDQDPPGADDCNLDWEDFPEQTYEGRKWNNQVTCNESDVGAAGVIVDAGGDPDALSGGAGVCNDGDTAPVQGRIVAGGSEDHGGVFVYADGTDGNEPPADGWVRADATTDGPNAGCGPDGNARERDASANGSGEYDIGNCG